MYILNKNKHLNVVLSFTHYTLCNPCAWLGTYIPTLLMHIRWYHTSRLYKNSLWRIKSYLLCLFSFKYLFLSVCIIITTLASSFKRDFSGSNLVLIKFNRWRHHCLTCRIMIPFEFRGKLHSTVRSNTSNQIHSTLGVKWAIII